MNRFGKMDWLLFGVVLALACLGLVMVYSASSIVAETVYGKANYSFLVKQGIAFFLGLALLIALSQIDLRKLNSPRAAFFVLGSTVLVLITVLIVGKQGRWFEIGIQIQPSEIAKPALVFFLAWWVSSRADSINTLGTVLPGGLALAAICGSVAIADFGTGVVMLATAAAIFYVAGLNSRYTRTAAALCVVMLAVGVCSEMYRLKRVMDFVDPKCELLCRFQWGKELHAKVEAEAPVQETRRQAYESRIGFGSGGVAGRGIMQSRQKLEHLPAAHTDFIFAIVGEELGLWGATGVLAGFVIILWRGYRLFLTSADPFARYLALGLTTCIVFQTLVNLTVVLDLGPTKGFPLPLISYGGSSLVGTLVMLGLLLSVSRSEQLDLDL